MDLAVTIVRLLRRFQQKNRFITKIPATGFTPVETHFLLELQANESRSISELADLLGIERSFGSRIVEKLEKEGLIKLKADRIDGRRKRLTVAVKGEKAIQRIDTFADDTVALFSSNISERERSHLVKLFSVIADGCGHPPGTSRKGEDLYRVEQRRLTQCFKLLGDNVYGTGMASTQWHALAEIALAKIPLQPSDLSDLLGVAQNSLSTTLIQLENRGFIRREHPQGDKRMHLLCVTRTGMDFVDNTETAIAKQIAKALNGQEVNYTARSVGIFERFVGEASPHYPPMLPGIRVHEASTPEGRKACRRFAAQALLDTGLSELLPEVFFPSTDRALQVFYNEVLAGCIHVRMESGSISVPFFAKSNLLSKWSMLGVLNSVCYPHFMKKHVPQLPGQPDLLARLSSRLL